MTARDRRARVPRRTVLTGMLAGPAAAALLASCSSTTAARSTSPAEVPDADARRRWAAIRTERDLAALVTAVAGAHPDLAGVLTPAAEHHREHVTTLRAEGPLPRLAGGPDSDATLPPPEVPSSAVDAAAAVVTAEEAAVEAHLAACAATQGPRLATILASAAASDAGIAALVEAR